MAGRELRALRLWLAAQVVASVIANWLGAEPTWEARVVALPAPLILFGSIESLLRWPGTGDLLSWTRGLGTIAVGASAGFLSFRHIGTLGAIGGLSPAEQVALVITLDGGMLVVALTLLMVSKQARPARRRRTTARVEVPTKPAEPLEVQEPDPAPLTLAPDQELSKDDRRALVLARTEAGIQASEISAETGVHIRTIRRDIAALRETGELAPEQQEEDAA